MATEAPSTAPKTPAIVKDLWASNTGRITCTEHGGGYLSAAIKARPRARKHTTSLDVWERMTLATTHPDDLAEEWLSCETCKARLS